MTSWIGDELTPFGRATPPPIPAQLKQLLQEFPGHAIGLCTTCARLVVDPLRSHWQTVGEVTNVTVTHVCPTCGRVLKMMNEHWDTSEHGTAIFYSSDEEAERTRDLIRQLRADKAGPSVEEVADAIERLSPQLAALAQWLRKTGGLVARDIVIGIVLLVLARFIDDGISAEEMERIFNEQHQSPPGAPAGEHPQLEDQDEDEGQVERDEPPRQREGEHAPEGRAEKH